MNTFENTVLKTKLQNTLQRSDITDERAKKLLLDEMFREFDAYTQKQERLSAIQEQMIQHLLAQYDIFSDERKTWAIYHVVRQLMSIATVRNQVKKYYDSKSFELLEKHLDQEQRMIEELKLCLDQLETKKDKTLETTAYKRAVEICKQISPIHEELYTVLTILLNIVHISKIPAQIMNVHVQLKKDIQYDIDRKDKPVTSGLQDPTKA